MDRLKQYVAKKKAEETLAKVALLGGALAAPLAIGALTHSVTDKVERDRSYTEYVTKNPETLKARHLLGEVNSVIKRDGLTIEASKTIRNMVSFYLASGSRDEQKQKLDLLRGELVMNMDGIDIESKRLTEEAADDFSRTLAKKDEEVK